METSKEFINQKSNIRVSTHLFVSAFSILCIMKKLVIQNLKDAFAFGLSFNDLAEIEDQFLKSQDYSEIIETRFGNLEFISASVSKNSKKTMYYKFVQIF